MGFLGSLGKVGDKVIGVLLSFALAVGFSPTAAFANEFVEAGERIAGVEGGRAVAPRSAGWQESGTCEWCIDEEGCLVVRPADGAVSGELEDWGYGVPPWWGEADSIRSVEVEGTVVAATASAMFEDCSNIESMDLSGLDTSNVKSMICMFCGCSSLKLLDLSSLDTSNVSDMQAMFYECSSLEVLNLSSFDTSAVEKAYREHQLQLRGESGCGRGGGLELEFDFGVFSMFGGCESLRVLALGGAFDFVACDGSEASDDAELYARYEPAGLRNPAANQVWRAVGSGTVASPKGATYSPVASLASAHSASDRAETYVVVEQLGGWVGSPNGWWYRNADGTYPKNCWMEIDGEWYHFDSSGYMQTGWLKLSGSWYYLKSSGAMATGWQKASGSCYYFNSSGAMQTGWLKSGGNWYYLAPSGKMATGWREIAGCQYYFNSSGVMQKSRWVGSYYLLSNGKMATSQWVDGGKYYVGADGKWAKNEVYWTPGGEKWHSRQSCPSLARSKSVFSGSVAQAKAAGKSAACKDCSK